ncbi:hypothetical protein LEP1GSC016_3334 [Leptospira borgpetersenii serovar Hardjo-bovis str. Sponselee]|uniref:Uncharacterized protein n=1 Tax=Leptospira borgpetersenii serovar Hardjo-bovis str. Sponselee TaxID=1303729 RepID=M6C0Z2_LEPBO|nr:hypothetical protein LEP1GSC016_3334 [Leptospira borgpetersenii serovar Hardjo-bovis str. Sponselee]
MKKLILFRANLRIDRFQNSRKYFLFSNRLFSKKGQIHHFHFEQCSNHFCNSSYIPRISPRNVISGSPTFKIF